LWRYSHEKLGSFRKVPPEGSGRHWNVPDGSGRFRKVWTGLEGTRSYWKGLEGSRRILGTFWMFLDRRFEKLPEVLGVCGRF